MNPHIPQTRRILQRAACLQLPVDDVWQGPGEPGQTEEFTIQFTDGTEIHVTVQEGSCPRA